MLLLPVLMFYYSQIAMGNISTSTIKDYAIVESQVAGLSINDQQKVIYTIDHESGFIHDRVNYNDMKEGCNSVGLVQIRDCNHPDVSRKQAEDPIFAVNFFIQNIDKCKTWWKNTCGKYKPVIDS